MYFTKSFFANFQRKFLHFSFFAQCKVEKVVPFVSNFTLAQNDSWPLPETKPQSKKKRKKKYVDLICQTSLFADKCINLTEIFQITQRGSKRQNSINAETIHVLNESYKKSNFDNVVVVVRRASLHDSNDLLCLRF